MTESTYPALLPEEVDSFRTRIWAFYEAQGRDLPWRRHISPYGVFVSEVMLQQTQVSRVAGRWEAWCARFDGFGALASAPNADVLAVWLGLGYNRRALWLKAAAADVVGRFGGQLPRDPKLLGELPGIGKNTAGSIAAFAYDEPTVFIETNIRRVFIHEFMQGYDSVDDRWLIHLIEQTLDVTQPRRWYWALMDYGSYLARLGPNANRRSSQYRRQPAFEGSARQMRATVLRRLVDRGSSDLADLRGDGRLGDALSALEAEGAIVRQGSVWRIAE